MDVEKWETMKQDEAPYLETRRDEEVTITARLVIQFDSEDGPTGGWSYFLNGVEISSELHEALKLPF